MTEKRKVITVFGSSRPEDGHADYAEAFELGPRTCGGGVCRLHGRIRRSDGRRFARRERIRRARAGGDVQFLPVAGQSLGA